jgi:hypothetical protein
LDIHQGMTLREPGSVNAVLMGCCRAVPNDIFGDQVDRTPLSPTISVIIVNWNGRDALECCLRSLEADAFAAEATELIVVDNGSSDGSVELLERVFPSARVIRNAENVGFAPAVNQGIRNARGEYVALVNNDVVATGGWLEELKRALDADPCRWAAAAQMRYLHQPGRINSAGFLVDLAGRARDRNDGMPASAEPSEPIEVFGASGGAVLIRRSVIDEIGSFDEQYFAYLEDVDLAWRARRAGYTCIYVPAAVVLHEHSATSNRVKGLKTYLSVRNHVWTLAKNASPRQLVVAAPVLAVLWMWTILIAAFEQRDTAGIRGLWHGLREVPALRRRSHGPYLRLREFAMPRPFRYRLAARARREFAARTVEPEIQQLADAARIAITRMRASE